MERFAATAGSPETVPPCSTRAGSMPLRRRRAGGRRIVALLLVAVAVTQGAAALSAQANAASSTVHDFSSLVANNPKAWTVDNCRVELGIVVDSVSYPNYRHVGGVRVNCSSVHSVIQATVALYYWTGSRWVQYGNGTFGARYGQAGSGTGISGILRTPAYCVGSLRTAYWMVGATVQTERTAATVYSNTSRALDGSGC
jgi:hypothetical protein